MSLREGWKCPECGRCNSPDVQTCSCYWEKRMKQGADSIKPPIKIGRVFPKDD